MKRNELKALVKECMLEILSESFIKNAVATQVSESIIVKNVAANTKQERIHEQQTHRNEKQHSAPNKIRDVIDNDDMNERFGKYNQILNNMKQNQNKTHNNNERVIIKERSPADALGIKDNVMRSILEDTEKTTVREQASHGDKYDGMSVDDLSPGVDISGISAAKNWAKMAGL